MGPKAQGFISRKVRYYVRDLGMEPKQAVRVAYAQARKKGYRVPAPTRKNVDSFTLGIVGPAVEKAAAVSAPRARRRRKASKPRRKKNAALDVVNPGILGPVIGDHVLSVEYRGGEGKKRGSLWRHDFSKAGAKVIGLKDGSVLIKRGKKPLWRYFK